MGHPVRMYREGYWYHVYVRGQREEPLFFAPDDRIRYLTFLDRSFTRAGGGIGSFCLMSNHVHLLVQMEETPLGDILRNAHSQYARDFNRRRDVRGHLIQKRPGVRIVLDESYLQTLVGYVHRNPVKAGMVGRVTDYPWSSWTWFLGEKCDWISIECWRFPPGFVGSNAAQAFREAVGSDADWPGGQNFIGSEEQWESLEKRQSGREAGRFRERRGRRELETIARELTSPGQFTLEDLKGPGRSRDLSRLRHRVMALMWEEGHPQTEIARFFNRTPRIVRKAINRFDTTDE